MKHLTFRMFVCTVSSKRLLFRHCVIVFAGLFVVGASEAEAAKGSAAPPDRLPNVVLVVIDTLRADHLGCYGYSLDTSPQIDSFSKSATFYPRSVSAAPWTLPTHTSLFTGRHVYEHRVHNYQVSDDTVAAAMIPADQTLLTEILRGEGFVTGAFVANTGYVNARHGFDRGFQTYHNELLYAEQLNPHVFAWLQENKEKSFFLFVNYMDTHRPYNTKPREGLLDRPLDEDTKLFNKVYTAVMSAEDPVAPDLLQGIQDQYDTSITHVDAGFGALLDQLKAHNLYDNTLIILTSDHGEYLGEHFLFGHGLDVYEGCARIPLIIKNVRQYTGRVVNTVISSVDIPRLLLKNLDRQLLAKHGEKFPYEPGNHPVLTENFTSRAMDLFHPVWGFRFQRSRTALYEWPFKFILSSDGNHELYNLDVDPYELRNLAASELQRTEKMMERIKIWRDQALRYPKVPPAARDLTEEEKQTLEALGYL